MPALIAPSPITAMPLPGWPASLLATAKPSAAEIETLLTIASRVPDHGKLAPWRFIVFEGEARELGAGHARQAIEIARRGGKPVAILSGGETTVTVRGKGRGGRNVEYLLSEAIAADGAAGIWGLSADTDGVDGAEDIAGAVFTPDTLARARAKGSDPQAMLDDNDGHGFFELLGDSLVTGPTRTNVNDFRVTLIAP